MINRSQIEAALKAQTEKRKRQQEALEATEGLITLLEQQKAALEAKEARTK